jgi:hypothetical protein
MSREGAALTKELHSSDLPLEGVCTYVCKDIADGRSSDSQAPYLLQLPNPCRISAFVELSFLLTAAGQSRYLTGFPFQSVRKKQTPEATPV